MQSSCFTGWIGEDLRWKGTGIQPDQIVEDVQVSPKDS